MTGATLSSLRRPHTGLRISLRQRLPDRVPKVRKRSRAGIVLASTAAVVAVAAGVGAGAVLVAHPDRSASSASVSTGVAAPVRRPAAASLPPARRPARSSRSPAKVMPSVVKLQLDMGGGRSEEGSGIVLSSDGLILTNNHVVAALAGGAAPQDQQEPGGPGLQLAPGDQAAPSGQDAVGGQAMKAAVTLSDGRTAPFTVAGADPSSDIAVVRAQGLSGLTPITLGSSKDLKVGQNVVAIGSPLGLQGTVTTGIISALDRPVSTGGEGGDQNTVLDAIQTDASINPGNSGGALVNMNGELIGVNSAIASLGGGGSPGAQSGSIGLGFAIPSDQAKRISDELIATGTATHASLGVQLSDDPSAQGASIAQVVDGGPAAVGRRTEWRGRDQGGRPRHRWRRGPGGVGSLEGARGRRRADLCGPHRRHPNRRGHSGSDITVTCVRGELGSRPPDVGPEG